MRTPRQQRAEESRERILQSARNLFATRGFDGTSLRDIANAADVDLGLLRYYFGAKKALYVAAIAPPIDLDAFAGSITRHPTEEWPRVMLTQIMEVMDSPAAPIFLGNIRNALRDQSTSQMLGEFMLEHLARKLTAAVPDHIPGDRHLRATALASQMVGLILARYVLRLEPLASADRSTIVAIYAPTLHRYLFENIEINPHQ